MPQEEKQENLDEDFQINRIACAIYFQPPLDTLRGIDVREQIEFQKREIKGLIDKARKKGREQGYNIGFLEGEVAGKIQVLKDIVAKVDSLMVLEYPENEPPIDYKQAWGVGQMNMLARIHELTNNQPR